MNAQFYISASSKSDNRQTVCSSDWSQYTCNPGGGRARKISAVHTSRARPYHTQDWYVCNCTIFVIIWEGSGQVEEAGVMSYVTGDGRATQWAKSDLDSVMPAVEQFSICWAWNWKRVYVEVQAKPVLLEITWLYEFTLSATCRNNGVHVQSDTNDHCGLLNDWLRLSFNAYIMAIICRTFLEFLLPNAQVDKSRHVHGHQKFLSFFNIFPTHVSTFPFPLRVFHTKRVLRIHKRVR